MDTLVEKLEQSGYVDVVLIPGLEEVLMLYVQGHLICGVDYALSLSEEDLQALVDETIRSCP